MYDLGIAVNELSMSAARNNLVVGLLERDYRRRKAAVYRETDPNTGKAITASKADVMAEETDEWHSWDMARRHYENNRDAEISLKSLIKAASERGDDSYVNPTSGQFRPR